MLFRTQSLGTQRRGDGKDCVPFPPLGKGERWAYLAIFFLALGLGDFAFGNAWNLLPEATGVVGFRLDSPAEEASTLVLAFLISCMRACE